MAIHSLERQTIDGQRSLLDYKDCSNQKVTLAGKDYSYPDQTFYYDPNSGARVRKEADSETKRPNNTSKNDGSILREYVKLMVTSTILKHVMLPLPVDTDCPTGTSILLRRRSKFTTY